MSMDYVLIIGPPAVGKATVAREVARLTGYRLVLNTLTTEMLSNIFARHERPFGPLHVQFQNRILEEALRAGMSVVGTVAWAFQDETNWRVARERNAVVVAAGGRTCIAELAAPFEILIERNRLPDRVADKLRQASTLSDEVLCELTRRNRFLAEPGELAEFGPYLRIESTQASATEAAARIVEAFGLSRADT